MDEFVVSKETGIRCYPKARPRLNTLSSYIGSFIVTNQRLMFLSRGGSGLGTRVLGGVIGDSSGMAMAGAMVTKNLDLSSLNNKGSLQIPLQRADAYEVKTMWGFTKYLSLRFRDSEGLARSYSFLCEGAEGSSAKLDSICAGINEAKARSESAPEQRG